MNLLITQYNNYFNRIIKKEDTLTNYVTGNYKYLINVNFNPNDGVTAEQIINWSESWNPNYIIAFDNSYTILHRWFIIDAVRTRAGQYKMSLKRDSIADYYDAVVDAPCYIEKAKIRNPDSPLLCNSEGLPLNQIKTSETLLSDETKCAWIVGYYDKTHRADMHGTVNTDDLSKVDTITVTNLSGWQYYSYINTPYKGDINLDNYKIGLVFDSRWCYYYDSAGQHLAGIDGYTKYLEYSYASSLTLNTLSTAIETVQTNMQANLTNVKNALINTFGATRTNINNFLAISGKTLHTTADGKYYKIHIDIGSPVKLENQAVSINSTLYTQMSNVIKPNGTFVNGITGTINSKSFVATYTYTPYTIWLEELTNLQTTWSVVTTSYLDTVDAPYNLFAIPYPIDGDKVRLTSSSFTCDLTREFALKLAQTIAYEVGANDDGGYCYDIQLLPYCPITGLTASKWSGEDFYRLDLTSVNVPYKAVQTSGTSVSTLAVIFDVRNSIFTKNIDYNLTIPSRTTDAALDIKLANECDMYRLCSPNYNGQFEFNLAKNGNIYYFNIDCTYKPFTPYIHVNPQFGKLYGQDFNDARGLNCGGDYSIPILNSAWVSYEHTNSTYKQVFDRSVQNIEKTNEIQKQEQLWSSLAGGLQGTVTGAFAGSIGGVGGAIAGAAIGGASSTLGGVADYNNLLKSQEEAKSFARDNFNYSLQNIKAMPDSLTKVGAFNNNNKIIPFIEYYTCSDEEVEAMKNKLEYDGMTVNAVAKMSNYITGEEDYIQGMIIRLDDVYEDAHMSDDIMKEISRGVYI